MIKKQDKKSIARYRIENAFAAIGEVETHLQNGFLSTAMNRIYYSGFYIISALAVLEGFSTSKHRQLIGYFNKNYINTGILEADVAYIINVAFEKRKISDYGDFVTITKSQIEEYYSAMQAFIDRVKVIIDKKLEEF